jgi:hypothetical protein
VQADPLELGLQPRVTHPAGVRHKLRDACPLHRSAKLCILPVIARFAGLCTAMQSAVR